MKREFLVTVILLSVGIMLASVFLKTTTHAAAQENSNRSGDPLIDAGQPAGHSELNTNVDISSPDSIRELIKTAALQLANSPPLQARLRYQIDMFGQKISGPGRYFQAGQGTRKTRIEFEFGFDDAAVQLHQFCDGHLLYNLTTAGDEASLEFVDLRRLDALQQNLTKADSTISSWLTVGSLTGLLDQLAEHFEFTTAEHAMLDNIPVINCTGQWRAAAAGRLLHGQIDPSATSDGKVRWQQLPEHLPHQVRLTLGNDNRFPYFPYRIVFEQFRLDGDAQVATPIAVLELYELKHAPHLSDDMFRLPSIDNTIPRDLTEFYEQRIQQFTR